MSFGPTLQRTFHQVFGRSFHFHQALDAPFLWKYQEFIRLQSFDHISPPQKTCPGSNWSSTHFDCFVWNWVLIHSKSNICIYEYININIYKYKYIYMHIYTHISYVFFWETYFVGTISTQKTWGVLTDLRNMQLPKATKSWAKIRRNSKHRKATSRDGCCCRLKNSPKGR